MTDYYKLETRIEEMIDDLQGLCSQNGLSNTAAEEIVVTTVFLYKFLNDKFMHNIAKFADELDMTVEEVLANEGDELDAFYDAYPRDVMFHMEDTIETLSNKVDQPDFAQQFDNALGRIANYEENAKMHVALVYRGDEETAKKFLDKQDQYLKNNAGGEQNGLEDRVRRASRRGQNLGRYQSGD